MNIVEKESSLGLSSQVLASLTMLSNTCGEVNEAYWELHYKLKKYDLYLAIPLIVASGFTSVSAIAQLLGSRLPIQIVTIIFSLLVTILAATQKYIAFDTRMVTAREVAKRWGSVKGKIDFYMLSISSITDHTVLLIIVQSIFNDIDAIGGTLADLPQKAKTPAISKTLSNVRQLIADSSTYETRL